MLGEPIASHTADVFSEIMISSPHHPVGGTD